MKVKFLSVLACLMSALCFSTGTLAFENFINSLSPYPSGCASYYMTQGIYPGGITTLTDGNILINSTTAPSAVTAKFTVYRTGCAEDNRSILWLRLEIIDDNDGTLEWGVVPLLSARVGSDEFPLRPTEEPSGWVNNESVVGLGEGTVRYYILDVPTPLSPGFDAGFFFIPSLYNGAFTLYIDNLDNDADYTVDIPAYNNELQPTFMPFTGRLSGIWVVVGASDQGFVISFSELPGDDAQGLIFFSWYTFDKDGKNVWLVGNATYNYGEGSITFELQLVTDGEFMGDKTATRLPAGTVTVTARHCNLLELDFDLDPIMLGQAVVSVVRLFGIETSGYTCMDNESKTN